MDVFVYDGPGTSSISVTHSITSLRMILHPDYTISTISPSQLAASPQSAQHWSKTCSLLVIPGGRDIPYLAALQGAANDAIKSYVLRGGSFLGVCAGAYYASAHLKWEEGTKIQVIGDRPLGFFPGTSVGCVYPGFSYASEDGARAVNVEVQKDGDLSKIYTGIYYNGGGHFEGADDPKMVAKGVRVIARYVDGRGKGKAAAVSCDVGSGRAIMWGPHLEFPLDFQPGLAALARSTQTLLEEDLSVMEHDRQELMRSSLSLLGLRLDRNTKL